MSDVVDELRHPPALLGPSLLLLLAERPAHGYELTERLTEMGFSAGGTSAVYRELKRLEDDGLVAGTWEAPPSRGPARKVYGLTPGGKRALVGCADSAYELTLTLEDYRRRVRAAMRRPGGSLPSGGGRRSGG